MKKLVWYVLNRYYPDFIGDEDVAQEARIGLWLACRAYDPSRGALSTIAVTAIRNEIRRYFRRQAQGGIPKEKLVSLETPMSFSRRDEEPLRLIDTLVGDADVQWVDLSGLTDRIKGVDREIFRLRITGLSMNEISRRVGLSKQAVDKRLGKIENLIRRMI